MKHLQIFLLLIFQLMPFLVANTLNAQERLLFKVTNKITGDPIRNISIIVIDEDQNNDLNDSSARMSYFDQTNKQGLGDVLVKNGTYFTFWFLDNDNRYLSQSKFHYKPDTLQRIEIELEPNTIKYQLKVLAFDKDSLSIPLSDVSIFLVEDEQGEGIKLDTCNSGERNCKDLEWKKLEPPHGKNGNMMIKVQHDDYKTQFTHFNFNYNDKASMSDGVINFDKRVTLEKKNFPFTVRINKNKNINSKPIVTLKFQGGRNEKILIDSSYTFVGKLDETIVMKAIAPDKFELNEKVGYVKITRDTTRNNISFTISKIDTPQFQLLGNEIKLNDRLGNQIMTSKFKIEIPTSIKGEVVTLNMMDRLYPGEFTAKSGEDNFRFDKSTGKYSYKFDKKNLDSSSKIRLKVEAEGYENFDSTYIVSYEEWKNGIKHIEGIKLVSIYESQDFNIKAKMSKVDSVEFIYRNNEGVIIDNHKESVTNYKRNVPFSMKLVNVHSKFDKLEIIITNEKGKCLSKTYNCQQLCEKGRILEFNKDNEIECYE